MKENMRNLNQHESLWSGISIIFFFKGSKKRRPCSKVVCLLTHKYSTLPLQSAFVLFPYRSTLRPLAFLHATANNIRSWHLYLALGRPVLYWMSPSLLLSVICHHFFLVRWHNYYFHTVSFILAILLLLPHMKPDFDKTWWSGACLEIN